MSYGIVDFHVHSAPSLVPRHHNDNELPGIMNLVGVEKFVMKAHEGSTAERASLLGGGAIGSIVLNSVVGGANPDAVETAAKLGPRVIWMPTLSARAHRSANTASDISVHKNQNFREVKVCQSDGSVCEEWIEIFDLVAEHDLVLASGHITMSEAIAVFRLARSRGVKRLLVNHPLLSFLDWQDNQVSDLLELDAFIEVGILADFLAGSIAGLTATERMNKLYPASRLVFGSDLGHCSFPDVVDVMDGWIDNAERSLGGKSVEQIIRQNGSGLVSA